MYFKCKKCGGMLISGPDSECGSCGEKRKVFDLLIKQAKRDRVESEKNVFGPNRAERRKRLRLRTRMSKTTWNDIYSKLYPGKLKNNKNRSILGKIRNLILG